MTSCKIVSAPSFTIGDQPGCCGIATVSRLGAYYPNPSHVKKQFNAWAEWTNKNLLYPYSSTEYKKWDLFRLVQATQRKPQEYVSTSALCTTSAWIAAAIPVEIAYAAVLQEMMRYNKSLYFMSDNMSNEGDVHLGPFSTRYFVQWLTDENLGTFQSSGPITSRRTGRLIQGWMFTPNMEVCAAAVARYKNDMLGLIKEWNSDIRIKGKDQAERKAEAGRAKALNRTILDEWYIEDIR